MKTKLKNVFYHLPKILFTFSLLVAIIISPKTSSDGIKNGITLLLSTVIPSLFPFLVLSSYIASSKAFVILSDIFKKPTNLFFRINPYGFTPILMGLVGGFPIGAKITADLYKQNKLTQNEAERLMFFTVNSGPAFTITAVGLGMLSNYYLGVILFLATVLSSLTLGFLCSFLSDKKPLVKNVISSQNNEFAFINSVSSGANAIINISAWILTFSCISAIIDSLSLNKNFSLFLNSIMEVTNGCKICSGKMSLPVISAILGFGGFSVICQCSPYLVTCSVKMKHFLVSRIFNSALSAFYTSQLLNIFNISEKTVVIYANETQSLQVSYTITATIILIIMSLIFILQVDNRKKVC